MDFPCRFVGGEKKHTYRDFLAGTVNGEERRDGLLHEAIVAQEVMRIVVIIWVVVIFIVNPLNLQGIDTPNPINC